MYRVLVLSPLPEGLVSMFFSEYLEKYGLEAEFVSVPHDITSGELQSKVSDADIIIGDYTMKIRLTSELIEKMRSVKLIAQPSTGYDNIDIDACKRKGIPVSNIGGANSASVAEHTIMLALMLMKRVLQAHSSMLEGRWIQDEMMNLTLDLKGKTWGIVGMGRIGKEVAKRLITFGTDTIYYDIVRLSNNEESELNAKYSEFQGLLTQSDVISVHLPLNEKTSGIFSEKEFRIMKPSSFFINVSRGKIVDEFAVAKAVKNGWISGAGIDVFSNEPVTRENPLVIAAREGANIILTPHIAGATNDARLRIIQTTVENVIAVMRGEKPRNVVNE